jgi:hypothetical protein
MTSRMPRHTQLRGCTYTHRDVAYAHVHAVKTAFLALTCFFFLPAAAQVAHDAFELLGEGQLGLLLDLEGLLRALAFDAGRALCMITQGSSGHIDDD